jgi:hypothetical protein
MASFHQIRVLGVILRHLPRFLVVLIVSSLAAYETVLPQGASLLPQDALGTFKLSGTLAKNVRCKRVPVHGQPFAEALRVEVAQQGEGEAWSWE